MTFLSTIRHTNNPPLPTIQVQPWNILSSNWTRVGSNNNSLPMKHLNIRKCIYPFAHSALWRSWWIQLFKVIAGDHSKTWPPIKHNNVYRLKLFFVKYFYWSPNTFTVTHMWKSYTYRFNDNIYNENSWIHNNYIKYLSEYTDVCVYSHVTFVLMISFGFLLIQIHILINMFQSFVIPFNNGFMQ